MQLGMVRGSAEHLLELVTDGLDLPRIEARQLEVEATPFDMDAVVRQVASLAPRVAARGLNLTVHVGPGAGTVGSEARRVEPVLSSLLANAVELTDTGEIRLRCTAGDGSGVATVRDTGIGTSERGLPRLAAPFSQLEGGLAHRFEGSGLSLAVCWRLAHLLETRIEVQGDVGRSSTFSSTLPRSETREAP